MTERRIVLDEFVQRLFREPDSGDLYANYFNDRRAIIDLILSFTHRTPFATTSVYDW